MPVTSAVIDKTNPLLLIGRYLRRSISRRFGGPGAMTRAWPGSAVAVPYLLLMTPRRERRAGPVSPARRTPLGDRNAPGWRGCAHPALRLAAGVVPAQEGRA